MNWIKEFWTELLRLFVPFYKQDPKPWKEVLSYRQICLLAVIFLVTFKIEHLQVFTLIGEHSQSVFLESLPRKEASNCRLVTVDAQEYDRLFAGACVSPNQLKLLICKILRAHPAVVVIDFDTSAKQFAGLDSQFDESDRDKIVWGRGADSDSSGKLMPNRLLGAMTPKEKINFGYALFQRNSNWAIRTFSREIDVNGVKSSTLFWAAVEKYRRFCEAAPGKCTLAGEVSLKNEEEVPIADLQYHFKETPVSDLITEEEAQCLIQNEAKLRARYECCSTAKKPEIASDSFSMENKVVLLGGTYSSGDRHSLGAGEANGVEIIAAAIENELTHQTRTPVGETFIFVAELLVTFLILAIHRSLRPIPAVMAMVGLSGIVFVGTFALLHGGSVVNFVPFFLAIWLEQLVKGTEEAAEKEPYPIHPRTP